VSHLTEVAVGDQDRLFHRFQPLGVYSREDVHARADGRGRVMALRFCRTERFDEPVSLDDYRRLVAGNPKSRSVILRSARRVSEHVFVSLLEMGFPDGR
jgi:predicted transcriptional regulator